VPKDEEKRRAEKVALLFLDALGRVVRSKMVEAGEARRLVCAWSDGRCIEMDQWEECELGKQYEDSGVRDGSLLKKRWTTRTLVARLWFSIDILLERCSRER